jgi:hypothetical protein
MHLVAVEGGERRGLQHSGPMKANYLPGHLQLLPPPTQLVIYNSRYADLDPVNDSWQDL